MRLVPLLALTYALNAAAYRILDLYDKFMVQYEKLNKDTPPMEVMAIVRQMKFLHNVLAGAKAFSTWRSLYMIEECRQSLGGLGYSSYTGLASLYQDLAVQVTWEVIIFDVVTANCHILGRQYCANSTNRKAYHWSCQEA